MSRIAYVNGRYVPHNDAAVHVEDRGFQFADGVYEVIAVRNGRLIDGDWHFDRLLRSLDALRIAMPMSAAAMRHILTETVRRNRVTDGAVYLQINRGVARRDHAFPAGIEPSIVCTAKMAKPMPAARWQRGISVISVPDIRWQRCDIKSVSLLPNVLAKQQARDAGAYEAWQVNDKGEVTEGSSTNAWIVTKDGAIVTRAAGPDILNGITRLRIFELAREEGLTVEERPFTVAEAKQAREAFLSSTSAEVLPVVEIDGTVVANGQPGSISTALKACYQKFTGEEKSEINPMN